MDFLVENKPETCAELGLACRDCVRAAAASVASVCQDMEPVGAQRVFFQLFPSPGCHPMAQAFELAYRESFAAPEPALAFASAAA